MIGGSFTVQGIAVLWMKKLKAMLTEPGPIDADRIADVQRQLHEASLGRKNRSDSARSSNHEL